MEDITTMELGTMLNMIGFIFLLAVPIGASTSIVICANEFVRGDDRLLLTIVFAMTGWLAGSCLIISHHI